MINKCGAMDGEMGRSIKNLKGKRRRGNEMINEDKEEQIITE